MDIDAQIQIIDEREDLDMDEKNQMKKGLLDEIDQYIHQLGSVSGNQKSSQGEMEYQIKYTEESPTDQKSKQLSKTYGAPSPKKSKKSVTRNSNKLSTKKTGKSKVSNGDKLEPTVTQNSKTSIEVVRAREQS